MNIARRETLASYAAAPVPGRWFIIPVRCRRPRWRLVCFPYAGAGASVYFAWARYLGQRDIEVWNIQYPGRESRLSDPPLREFSTMIRQLTDALRPLEAMDIPLAFFGHSMGAVLAYETASALLRQNRPVPSGLFLSGRNAPSHRHEPFRLHDLPPEELLDTVAKFGDLSEAILNEPELIELLMPALRADFAMLHNYQQSWDGEAAARLPCLMSVFGGDQDPWTHAEGLAAWRLFTDGQFNLSTYPGGHFFINDHRQTIWRAIEADLTRIEDRPGTTSRFG
jgi:medium-chain acyl-[acyl-carrier-protein] hydrolase